MCLEPLPHSLFLLKNSHPGFKGASWVHLSRTDSRVHPHIGYLWRLMLATGLRDNWWRPLKMITELKICEVSKLARVAKNAESQSFGGFLYYVYQLLRMFWEITLYKSRERKEGEKCLPEKGISLAQIFGDCQSQQNLLLDFSQPGVVGSSVEVEWFPLFFHFRLLSWPEHLKTHGNYCAMFVVFKLFEFSVCDFSWSDIPIYRQGGRRGWWNRHPKRNHRAQFESQCDSSLQNPKGQKYDSIWP